MIYVTGDTHADWMSRLSTSAFPEQREMTKDDSVIILGDFGIWDGSKGEGKRLDWLENKPFTTLFVDGNHENYDILDGYPVEEWNGAKVHKIRPSILHILRGQVFSVNGCTFFAFGGARSHDIADGILEKGDPKISRWNKQGKMFRVNHVSWWEREMPSQEEMEEGRMNLEKTGNKVDFIISHCAPSSTVALFSQGLFAPDPLTQYLEEIRQKTDYKRWLFGHYHENMAVNDKDIMLYEQIVRIA